MPPPQEKKIFRRACISSFYVSSNVTTVQNSELETIKIEWVLSRFQSMSCEQSSILVVLLPVVCIAGLSSLGVPAPPDFGRSVNPISTKGGRLCPPNITGNPRFSDLPTALYCIKKLQFFVLIKISVKVIIRLWSSLHLFVDCELFFSGLGLHC